jgi:hypothetical protein
MSAMAWDSSGVKQERRFAARRLKDLVTGSPYRPVGDMMAQGSRCEERTTCLGTGLTLESW